MVVFVVVMVGFMAIAIVLVVCEQLPVVVRRQLSCEDLHAHEHTDTNAIITIQDLS